MHEFKIKFVVNVDSCLAPFLLHQLMIELTCMLVCDECGSRVSTCMIYKMRESSRTLALLAWSHCMLFDPPLVCSSCAWFCSWCVRKMWQEFCRLGCLARGGVLPLEERRWCGQGHANDLSQRPLFAASTLCDGGWCHVCACWRNRLPWHTEVSFLNVICPLLPNDFTQTVFWTNTFWFFLSCN